MASQYSLDQKRSTILDSILPMLRNDISRVCDATCADHGRPGPAPNFTAALVCLVACEVVGRLSAADGQDDDATVGFIRSIATITGDARYRDAAKALFVFFRHGLAHSFLPKQPAAVRAQVLWATVDDGLTGVCLASLATAAGGSRLAALRAVHLGVSRNPDSAFVLVPQVLALDVLASIDAFGVRLQDSDPATISEFESGFEKWWGRTSSVRGQLDEASRRYLGL